MNMTVLKSLTIATMLTASLVRCGVEKFECQPPSEQATGSSTVPPPSTTQGTGNNASSSPLVTKRLKIADLLGTWEGTWDTQIGRSQRGNVTMEIRINDANVIEWDITANGGHMNDYDPVTGEAIDSVTLLAADGKTVPFNVQADDTDKLGAVDLAISEEGQVTGEFHSDTPMQGCITADEIVGEFKLQHLIRGTVHMLHTIHQKDDDNLF